VRLENDSVARLQGHVGEVDVFRGAGRYRMIGGESGWQEGEDGRDEETPAQPADGGRNDGEHRFKEGLQALDRTEVKRGDFPRIQATHASASLLNVERHRRNRARVISLPLQQKAACPSRGRRLGNRVETGRQFTV
jgi:hypothetical protein